ncbi:SDR family NAD(P)-dependent oxidoreductase [Flavobacterium sp. GT3R68]|uniref:SDR family NAD(P)-dependent oxidoreductase n=1 Tax=Flavobacterium sp. GT3R68 TaxID=2594437 RepID=UPI000F87B1FD|nr:SDR family oxidoreductase [Flavobacterium sp. GT3R68]RTY89360.1 SDR family oxidoreductase [Flavobacterium sp. GSN2]TRW93920.1 SDR family oxidoreductase [Flavobacterium sp. GT3R68]
MEEVTKAVFVSGGARGIGKAICLKFAEDGYQVYFTYKSNEAAADELVEFIETNYSCPKPKGFMCDMTNPEAVKQIFKENRTDFSSIQTLVNNAGGHGKTVPFLFCSNDHFWDMIDLNLKSVVNAYRETLPIFIKNKGGRVVNITSLSGPKGNPGHSSYAASKAAVASLSKSILKEIGPMGITINSVAPAFVETDSIKDLTEKYYKLRIENSILKRMATAEEIANLVHYLGSTSPAYLTGQEIIIDGGISG